MRGSRWHGAWSDCHEVRDDTAIRMERRMDLGESDGGGFRRTDGPDAPVGIEDCSRSGASARLSFVRQYSRTFERVGLFRARDDRSVVFLCRATLPADSRLE